MERNLTLDNYQTLFVCLSNWLRSKTSRRAFRHSVSVSSQNRPLLFLLAGTINSVIVNGPSFSTQRRFNTVLVQAWANAVTLSFDIFGSPSANGHRSLGANPTCSSSPYWPFLVRSAVPIKRKGYRRVGTIEHWLDPCKQQFCQLIYSESRGRRGWRQHCTWHYWLPSHASRFVYVLMPAILENTDVVRAMSYIKRKIEGVCRKRCVTDHPLSCHLLFGTA